MPHLGITWRMPLGLIPVQLWMLFRMSLLAHGWLKALIFEKSAKYGMGKTTFCERRAALGIWMASVLWMNSGITLDALSNEPTYVCVD